jgi:2-polyprenyl-6-methoxyphenol hydroxylase-like FAD-dependent oxidoreductase
MTLAALLGRAGRRVVVLERYADLYNLPRAACFDDEIMRTFQKLGVAEEMGRCSVVQPDYEWLNAQGETLLHLEYADPAPGGWAAQNMMYQPDVETVLDRLVRSLPTVEVRQGVTVTGIEQDGTAVTLSGAGPEGEGVTVRARYAVGADGGSGFTRRTFGAGGLDDYGFQENWLVCDFRLRRRPESLPTFRQVCDPAQPRSIVRIGPHNHRFSFMLDPDVTAEQATDRAGVWSRVAEFLTPHDAELIRAANYVFRSRMVEQWRHGRVFLAGDAAHEMPPFLAQGMCSGIRDSHNLAWKLDLVLAGQADEALLDTYQVEREPHVRFIIEKAIELGRVQTLRDPEAARARDQRLRALRAARQAPEKLQLPGLSGPVARDGGGFFPQGRVRANGREGLFDDVMGEGWRLVAADVGLLEGVRPAQQAFWRGLGGFSVAIRGPGGFDDLDHVYADWFAANGCAAVVVRPDWYVFATAKDGAGLDRRLSELAETLASGSAALPARRCS